MKKIVILIINLTFLKLCFGQGAVLKGEIKDFKTGEYLPYATIEIFNLKTGTITDKDGKFNFNITPINLNHDTICFSYVGYETKKMSIDDFIQSSGIIELNDKPVVLGEITVIPKKYSIIIAGIKNKEPLSPQYANLFGANKGNFIENKQKKKGWIKSVSYYIHSDGYPTTPFRVRVYDIDENKKPGKDILNKNVVVSASNPGWFTVELSEYNIPFPSEGVFVMMEWINSGDKYYFEKDVTVKGKNEQTEVVKKKYYGQSLGTVSEKGGVVLWGNNLGNEWIPYDFNYKGKYPNAMINAEIIYEKD
jgi:hypothetical protein